MKCPQQVVLFQETSEPLGDGTEPVEAGALGGTMKVIALPLVPSVPCFLIYSVMRDLCHTSGGFYSSILLCLPWWDRWKPLWDHEPKSFFPVLVSLST